MRPHSSIALWLGAVVLPACGTQPAPPPVQPAPPPTVSAAAPPPPAEPDLSPVAAPRNVVALGRWANAASTLKTIEAVGKLPLPLDTLIQKELNDKELFALIKLDSAIDGAVVIDPASPPDDPKFLGVVSLPLRDMSSALALANRAGKPVSVKPGVYRIGRAKDLVCDLSVAVGDAPARLLCSEHERDLDMLVPWLTRGLPKDQFGASDLHLELRAEGLRDRYKEELERFGPLLPGLANKKLRDEGVQQQALIDLVTNAAADAPKFVNDLDSLTLDVRLDGTKTEASISGSVKLKSTTSWVSKMMTHRNDKAGAAPPIFWQAPKDSDSASFNHGSDPKMLDGLREGLSAGAKSLLTGKLDGADVQAISDLLAKIPMTDAQAIVVTRGHLPAPKAERTLKPTDFKPADAVKASQSLARGVIGWSLVGVETKADPYVAWLKDLVKAYNSRTLQGTIKKAIGKDAVAHYPTLKVVGAPKGAPAGTTAVELSIPITSKDVWYSHGKQHEYREHPKGAEAKGSISITLTVTPDGNRTWIGVASDTAALGSHLAVVKDGSPKEGTISARPGLDALKSGSFTGGGFFSVGGAINTFASTARSTMSERKRKEMDDVLAAMPNKGETPVLLFTNGTTGSAPVNSMEIRIQKGTIDDAVALAFMALKPRRLEEAPPAMVVPPPPPPAPRPKKK